ncbi:TetR family transcriptional regulator C-terminal domain-containing protein [Clostridium estertheticum]|uniref:TetR/AcrR family transcriptional regulator n=1 Tax=Clostridium estertheticum TaxID=238834 RepID=UPI001C0D3B31|nr:TetR-like C-terminal domain-containing protein [Clostridium estertheticum]MBU3179192.1 TetR family transcriptional regulator C-terminal domain-containing protein [Clostridium estertheticum]
MQKENRRVRITKLLLNESFLRLLSKKPLARFTVKEICADADLNRSTYYQYYTDPYDQMTKLEEDIIEEMTSYVDTIKDEPVLDYSQLYQVIKKMLDYMHAKREMFRVLLNNNGDISIQKDILTVFSEKFLPPDFKTSKDKTELLQDFIFVSNGSFGIIFYWLMIDNAESTADLAKRITDFVEDFLQSRKKRIVERGNA